MDIKFLESISVHVNIYCFIPVIVYPMLSFWNIRYRRLVQSQPACGEKQTQAHYFACFYNHSRVHIQTHRALTAGGEECCYYSLPYFLISTQLTGEVMLPGNNWLCSTGQWIETSFFLLAPRGSCDRTACCDKEALKPEKDLDPIKKCYCMQHGCSETSKKINKLFQ